MHFFRLDALLVILSLVAARTALAAQAALAAPAQPPRGLERAFEGRLHASDGRPLDGSYLLRFKLWNAAEGGAEVWSESLYVAAEKGRFEVVLGRFSSLPESVLRGAHRVEAWAPAGTGWKPGGLRPRTQARPAAAPAVEPKAQEASAAYSAPSIEQRAAPASAPAANVRPEGGRDGALPRGAELPRIYEVRAGDSLRSIALKLYGDADRWNELYNANDDRIMRGGDLVPGQKLIVPRESGGLRSP